MVELADEFTQLVFHVLAHVRCPGPGSIFDPRYVEWAARRFSAEATALLEHDADLLGRLWAGDPRYDRLDRFCDLHRRWVDQRAAAGRSLAQLGPEDVADPRLLAGLRELDGAELLHATLGLLGAEFMAVFASLGDALDGARRAVSAWIEGLVALVPGLERARVELVWALGQSGRALPGRILVGAPVAWNGCSPARQAVLAAHEHLVATADGDDYVSEEWAALTGLASRLRGAAPELREAHREWLASLDLSALIDAALARGYVLASEAEALVRDVEDRPERLSAARAGGSP